MRFVPHRIQPCFRAQARQVLGQERPIEEGGGVAIILGRGAQPHLVQMNGEFRGVERLALP